MLGLTSKKANVLPKQMKKFNKCLKILLCFHVGGSLFCFSPHSSSGSFDEYKNFLKSSASSFLSFLLYPMSLT